MARTFGCGMTRGLTMMIIDSSRRHLSMGSKISQLTSSLFLAYHNGISSFWRNSLRNVRSMISLSYTCMIWTVGTR
ncbi:hypothetical protein LINPERHAP1_LOCUS7929 [Linum perenne]